MPLTDRAREAASSIGKVRGTNIGEIAAAAGMFADLGTVGRYMADIERHTDAAIALTDSDETLDRLEAIQHATEEIEKILKKYNAEL